MHLLDNQNESWSMSVSSQTYLSRPDEETFAIDFETVVVPLDQVSNTIASKWPLCLLRVGESSKAHWQGERQAPEKSFHDVCQLEDLPTNG
jgi:hypothetical protein